jgi:hypothetical protein
MTAAKVEDSEVSHSSRRRRVVADKRNRTEKGMPTHVGPDSTVLCTEGCT